MIVCSKCGSDDIQQEASIMLPINDSAHHLGFHKILEDLEWQDFYWFKKSQTRKKPPKGLKKDEIN